MLRFRTSHVMILVAIVAVSFTLFVSYRQWRYQQRLIQFDVAFIVNDQRLPITNEVVEFPAEWIDREMVEMVWTWKHADHDGSSSSFQQSQWLQAEEYLFGISLLSKSIATQGVIEDSGTSSRFFWSCEPVTHGCVVYANIQLYEDGKISDSLSRRYLFKVKGSESMEELLLDNL